MSVQARFVGGPLNGTRLEVAVSARLDGLMTLDPRPYGVAPPLKDYVSEYPPPPLKTVRYVPVRDVQVHHLGPVGWHESYTEFEVKR